MHAALYNVDSGAAVRLARYAMRLKAATRYDGANTIALRAPSLIDGLFTSRRLQVLRH